jgi:hypothetical protein
MTPAIGFPVGLGFEFDPCVPSTAAFTADTKKPSRFLIRFVTPTERMIGQTDFLWTPCPTYSNARISQGFQESRTALFGIEARDSVMMLG